MFSEYMYIWLVRTFILLYHIMCITAAISDYDKKSTQSDWSRCIKYWGEGITKDFYFVNYIWQIVFVAW